MASQRTFPLLPFFYYSLIPRKRKQDALLEVPLLFPLLFHVSIIGERLSTEWTTERRFAVGCDPFLQTNPMISMGTCGLHGCSSILGELLQTNGTFVELIDQFVFEIIGDQRLSKTFAKNFALARGLQLPTFQFQLQLSIGQAIDITDDQHR